MATNPTFDQLTIIGGPEHGNRVELAAGASTLSVVQKATLTGIALTAPRGEIAPSFSATTFEYVRAQDGGFSALVPSRNRDLIAIWRTMIEECRARGAGDLDLVDDLIAGFLFSELERRGLSTDPLRIYVASMMRQRRLPAS